MSRIFLEEGKSTSFLLIRSFKQSNRNSEGSVKSQKFRRGQGLTILEFEEHGGRAFWNFLRQGGRLKC